MLLINTVVRMLHENIVGYGKLISGEMVCVGDRVKRSTLIDEHNIESKLMFQPEDLGYVMIYIAEGIMYSHVLRSMPCSY